MIRFKQVTKRLSGRNVLDNLDFEIAAGEVFVIVGPSGTGKSVTLKHIVRLLTPTSGSVWIDDTEISAADGAGLDRVRERFGYLFQGGALLGWLTVAENIALPLREKTRLDEDEIARRVAAALKAVGLEEDGDKLPSEISGGMQKRAGLARAIVNQPEIVLYDEPTSGLDPVTSRTIDALIKRLNKELGITSIVVTHDLQGALLFADRIAMLTGGKFVEVSPPKQFVATDQPDVRRFLDAQFIPRSGLAGM
ncbi:MAG: ATP-binding cassette domain-containing protein [Verrucomicrobiota bacterium]|jgi:phospholipid/cholesterol/gamma-HCH transport system ATP-binding protein|nr:ATP-binding cassette domain-containing protein [Verrucomicrobiota bacterium]